ncbi:MAG: hypothetical protein F4W95_01835, partial [Chloroflexi bacterium]|nr:hypothetical protein [Chloroflexota bacterium]
MDVALRRMRAEDIPQVIAIEREAFSPGWVGTPFRRDLNSRYCRFLVAYLPDDDDTHSLDDAAQPASGAPAAGGGGAAGARVKPSGGSVGTKQGEVRVVGAGR